jgi:hypothetical protein
VTRRGGRFGALAALACALLLAGCAGLQLGEPFTGVIHPDIKPSTVEQGIRMVEHEFAFEGDTVRLSVPVDRAVYAGAVTADKHATFVGTAQPPDWVGDYYRAFIDEEHQEPFYASLLEALHAVRDERDLDAARYVELVAAMAQGLEYRIDPGDLAPKFPIETFAEGFGDCDDKTLLAAGLLARDGYDVAVLFFETEEHVALGVRAPGLDYKDSGYAYVETTEPLLVGLPPEKLTGDVELASEPAVVRIGNGAQEYSAAKDIAYIRRRTSEVREAREELDALIRANNIELEEQRATLSAEKERMEDSGAIHSQAEVREYNERVREYNDLVRTTNETVARYNELVAAERFVAENQTDRPGVRRRLEALGSATP